MFTVGSEILEFDTFKAFAHAEGLGETDLIVTNEFIYNPFIRSLGLNCKLLFQEKYGSGEPNDSMIDAIRADMPKDAKRIIAIGGGTVIDISKLLIFDGEFKTAELFTDGIVPTASRTLIAVPTTCGTGSEVTNLTIVELKSLKTKKGLGLKSMYPSKAALIPEMVKTLPYKFFATSSVDALIHASEAMLSPKSNAHTDIFSENAIRLIINGYKNIVSTNTENWVDFAGDFLVASNFAGIAFANAGVAAVHALSYPLGGAYHIPHGEANQLMFMAVFNKYREKKPAGKINRFEKLIGEILKVPEIMALEALGNLLEKVLKKMPLKDYGVKEDELPEFAKSVIEGQQRLLVNNYVELTEAEILKIYLSCY